jgi:hypothetical protein
MKNAETITQNWIRANGMQVSTFNSTPIKLLQAQQQATNLLRNYIALLTTQQVQTLQNFQKRMSHKNTRSKLKPEHAYPVLNIATKVKRIEHKQKAN